MPSFEEVEKSKGKGKRSTFRHKCANFAISADGTLLMYYKMNKYDSNKKPASIASTPIQIISDALYNDVIADRDLRFKPPTKGYMIANSMPLDVHRNVIVHPKFGTARMFKCTVASKPKNIRKIVAEGNCPFRAFSFCLTGSEQHHLTVRRAICDYMEFFSSVWQPLMGTHTIAEFLDRGVRTSGIDIEHWGTKIEMLVFAILCN
uniref:Uncharacterized protein n=1 Tax=Plectus sambesii TaxID=2011161 RepID=A0A914X5H3_9BILA